MLFGKRELYLDGSQIFSVEEFHDQVSQLFGFPSYYGRNLDDLWECLNSYIDPNLRLTIRDFEHLIQVLQLNDAIGRLQNVNRLVCPVLPDGQDSIVTIIFIGQWLCHLWTDHVVCQDYSMEVNITIIGNGKCI